MNFKEPAADIEESMRQLARAAAGRMRFADYSHLQAAELFSLACDGQVVWCPDMQRWAVWTGTHWELPDNKWVYAMVANFLEVFGSMARVDEALGRRAESVYKETHQAAYLNATVNALRSRKLVWQDHDNFDSDDWLLNCANGVIDLRTGDLLAHDPKHLTSRIAAARYDPDAKLEGTRFGRFLNEVFEDDQELIRFVQAAIGYTCTGDSSIHYLLYLYGDGRNGKSTLGEAVAGAMGNYALKVGSSVFMSVAGESHPTELAQLRGVRLAFSSEIERNAYWNEARIKELTGDNRISARFMRQDFFTFRRTHKHLIYGNERPRLRATDDAIAGRIKFIDFNVNFERIGKLDPSLPERLREEAPVVLKWLVDGARAVWLAGCKLPLSQAERATTAAYLRESNSFEAWLEENCVVSETPDTATTQMKTAAAALYLDYHQWKRSRGELPESIVMWSRAMSKRFLRRIINKKPYWLGIGLVFEPDSEQVAAAYGDRGVTGARR